VSGRRALADVWVGETIGELRAEVDRARLVAYAAASGDHNPIHWNERVATSVGLPGVIAHGMWTMGAASTILTRWAGDPAAVLSYSCRFTKPVPVPDPGSAELVITGRVSAVDSSAGTADLDLDVRLAGTTVLGRARATVKLS